VGDTEIWAALRKSFIGQMVRSFFYWMIGLSFSNKKLDREGKTDVG
jgi:hypothetical protein